MLYPNLDRGAWGQQCRVKAALVLAFILQHKCMFDGCSFVLFHRTVDRATQISSMCATAPQAKFGTSVRCALEDGLVG